MLTGDLVTLPSGETHEIGSCVYVKHIDSENDTLEPEEQWKAQVLEVRALDENHVYLRVVWLENPTELPVGEKPYHGKHELIASNEMAIIDAMTVNGGLDVVYWDEEKDDEAMPDPDVYFWRQTYDRRTGALSVSMQSSFNDYISHELTCKTETETNMQMWHATQPGPYDCLVQAVYGMAARQLHH